MAYATLGADMIRRTLKDRLAPLGRMLLQYTRFVDRLVGEPVQRYGIVFLAGWEAGGSDTPRWLVVAIWATAAMWTVLLIAAHRIERRRQRAT